MLAARQNKCACTADLIQVITLVLWAGCLVVGIIGFLHPYSLSSEASSKTRVMVAEKNTIKLTLSEQPQAPPPPQPSAKLSTPPATPALVVITPSARLTPIINASQPEPAVAAQLASTSTADPTGRQSSAQPLAFGQGEGRQPLPAYPSTARLLGQEGTVTVRINVMETGGIASAEIASRSHWPLLNEAAIRTVRERWRFAPGKARIYEVAIRFSLRR